MTELRTGGDAWRARREPATLTRGGRGGGLARRQLPPRQAAVAAGIAQAAVRKALRHRQVAPVALQSRGTAATIAQAGYLALIRAEVRRRCGRALRPRRWAAEHLATARTGSTADHETLRAGGCSRPDLWSRGPRKRHARIVAAPGAEGALRRAGASSMAAFIRGHEARGPQTLPDCHAGR